MAVYLYQFNLSTQTLYLFTVKPWKNKKQNKNAEEKNSHEQNHVKDWFFCLMSVIILLGPSNQKTDRWCNIYAFEK